MKKQIVSAIAAAALAAALAAPAAAAGPEYLFSPPAKIEPRDTLCQATSRETGGIWAKFGRYASLGLWRGTEVEQLWYAVSGDVYAGQAAILPAIKDAAAAGYGGVEEPEIEVECWQGGRGGAEEGFTAIYRPQLFLF